MHSTSCRSSSPPHSAYSIVIFLISFQLHLASCPLTFSSHHLFFPSHSHHHHLPFLFKLSIICKHHHFYLKNHRFHQVSSSPFVSVHITIIKLFISLLLLPIIFIEFQTKKCCCLSRPTLLLLLPWKLSHFHLLRVATKPLNS